MYRNSSETKNNDPFTWDIFIAFNSRLAKLLEVERVQSRISTIKLQITAITSEVERIHKCSYRYHSDKCNSFFHLMTPVKPLIVAIKLVGTLVDVDLLKLKSFYTFDHECD